MEAISSLQWVLFRQNTKFAGVNKTHLIGKTTHLMKHKANLDGTEHVCQMKNFQPGVNINYAPYY